MNLRLADVYRCPYSGETLRAGASGLVSEHGHEYPIVDGIPHLIDPDRESFGGDEAQEREYYETTAHSYDEVIDWLFQSFFEDEAEVRQQLVDLLELRPGDRVLEVGAGTCRDTIEIVHRLEPDAQMFVQDLSPSMLAIGRGRMEREGLLDGAHGGVEFFVGNASHLPFGDGFFDAVFHFGGFNLFGDKERALSEMVRVVRLGGKVVLGDEGLAPWHRDSEYGAILMNSNRLYEYRPPVELLPESARDASVRWMIGNAFYVIDFRVGDGPPPIDLDLPILGKRGGTHRTRYFGTLEGVTLEAKEMAQRAAEAAGLSMYEWLDRTVRDAAERARESPGSSSARNEKRDAR